MLPDTDAAEQPLNEPYILSPYKLCVANYLLAYMEQKNAAESTPGGLAPDPLSHCYLGFRLMMSLDCPYEELRSQLAAPVEPAGRRGLGHGHQKIDAAVLKKFDAVLGEIQSAGLSKLYEFVKRLQKVLAKKAAGRGHHTGEDLFRVHRLSMAGLFLRKFIIHFERLSFGEVAILHSQLERYLNGETDHDYLPVQPVNPISSTENAQEVEASGQLDLSRVDSKLDRLEAKLAQCDDAESELVRHLKAMIRQARARSTVSADSSLACSMSMSLDDITLEPTATTANSTSPSRLHSQQASQHFLLKQVYRILVNEHSALPPPAIVDFINFYFEQHNRFHYQRFIQLNYRANLNMIRRTAAQELSSGTSSTSNTAPTGTATGAAAGTNNPGAGATANSGAAGAGAASGRQMTELFQSINHYSDIHYLKFINALRVNNYTAAQECFYSYFDLKRASRLAGSSANATSNNTANGPPATGGEGGKPTASSLNSSDANFCWSALNLAIMYAHFRHYRLAYEALTDCISVAREKRDERCLQYAMIWLLLILQQFSKGHGNGQAKEDEPGSKPTSRAAELAHRHHKAYNDLSLIQNLVNLIALNELGLPYIAAMAHLHLEKQVYLRPIFPSLADSRQDRPEPTTRGPRRPPLTTKPLVLAVRYLMDDVLLKCYASHAAVLNAYGALHLGAVTSALLARLDLVEMVDQELVAHVCESQAIACRNLAFHRWTVRGDADRALELLTAFSAHYSPHNNPIRQVIEQAAAEIRFERFLFAADWTQAARCVNLVRLTSRTAALMMLAELRRRQKEPIAALECIDLILGGAKGSAISGAAKNARVPLVGVTLSNGLTAVAGEPDDDEDSVVMAENDPAKRNASVQTLSTPPVCQTRRPNQPTSASANNSTPSTPFSPSSGPRPSAVHRLPSTLEPEEERALTLDLDPYAWISCHLTKATILADLSGLLDCVVKAQAHGFRVLETRALLEIARIQQSLFGQCAESQKILNSLMIRLLANGTLKDLATAYFLTATNHLTHHRKGGTGTLVPVPLDHSDWSPLEAATWANARAMAVWRRIGEQTALLESLHLQAFIEHERGAREQRNYFARQAKLLRAQLIK